MHGEWGSIVTSIWSDQQTGPASYPTGGFVLTTTLSTVKAFDVIVQTVGNLGRSRFVLLLDTPSPGQVTVKVMRENFNLYSTGAITGLPSGVTGQTASGQNLTAEAAHTMDITHGHSVSAASATMTGGSGLVTQAATGGVNTSTHTHTITIGNAAFTSGAGSSHTHTWNNIYGHQHNITETVTNVALTELANGTDLSTATMNFFGVDG